LQGRNNGRCYPQRVKASEERDEYTFDGPRKIDTKEGRALETFLVSRQGDEASHLPVTKTKQPREEMIE
jgi:hypothetical protein